MAKKIRLPLHYDEDSPSTPSPPPDASVKDRWQFRRDLVICLAFREGYSRKYLADVFDVHRSKINKIIDDLSVYGESGLPRDPLPPGVPKLAAPSPLPPGSTPGQRWRYRRNRLIYLAHRQGLSQRFIADVFDLPRSRVGEIIKEISGDEKHAPGDLPRTGESTPGLGSRSWG
jgi:transposase